MNEFLILFALKSKSLNIYEIKKFIDENFSPFFSISSGAIIPALKRLEAKEFVKSDKKISEGGLRRSFYEITSEGNEYFNDLLKKPFAFAPQVSGREIEIFLSVYTTTLLSQEQRLILKERLTKKLNSNISNINKLLNNSPLNVLFLKEQIEFYKNILQMIEKDYLLSND